MLVTLQRAIARVAAVAALVLGATVALFLAAITVVAGLVLGLIASLAAWFGLRANRRAGSGFPGTGGQAGPQRRDSSTPTGTVIDVEMREISRDGQARPADTDDSAGAGGRGTRR